VARLGGDEFAIVQSHANPSVLQPFRYGAQ
jgi:GGDEF domain-containing protein